MDHERRFDVLAHVVEIANASVEAHERLDSILGTINKHLGSRLAVLFLQEAAKSQLTQSNVWPRQAKEGKALEVPLARARWAGRPGTVSPNWCAYRCPPTTGPSTPCAAKTSWRPCSP